MRLDGSEREKRDLTPTNDDESVGEWSEGRYELIPEDDHEVRFLGFKIEQHETYGQRLNLLFDTVQIETSNGEPFRVATWAGATFSARGKIRPLLNAMGVDVDAIDRASFKLSAYTGGRLRLNIIHETVQGNDGPYERAKVAGFLKSKLGKRQPWDFCRPGADVQPVQPKPDTVTPATPPPDPKAVAAAERKRKLLEEDDD